MAPEKNEKDLLKEISGKLDRLIAFTAIQGKDTDTQIDILTKLGFKSPEIGPFIGLHPDAVRQRRSRKKRPGSSRPPEVGG